jgi:predicted nucleotidyltransferase component of viral defense system
VRQRLLNLSRETGDDFQLVLNWYGLERLLYRLGRSDHGESFILKGAMLFSMWGGRVYRMTRDLDLLGFGDASPERLTGIFEDLCTMDVEPDGLVFDEKSIRVRDVREEQTYQGQRVQLIAHLGTARIDLQIDIGFGDVVHPEAILLRYPTLLKSPHPKVKGYPPESVIAEKFQAIVALGMGNSRMKDFYDIWTITKQFTFEGSVLIGAIRTTFERRRTPIPDSIPRGFSDEFASNPEKVNQWKAFLKRTGLEVSTPDLKQVVQDLRAFLMPLVDAETKDEASGLHWKDGGAWS